MLPRKLTFNIITEGYYYCPELDDNLQICATFRALCGLKYAKSFTVSRKPSKDAVPVEFVYIEEFSRSFVRRNAEIRLLIAHHKLIFGPTLRKKDKSVTLYFKEI